MKKKLLLIGNHTIHTYNYYHLIKDYFDEICLITDIPRAGQNVEPIHYVSFSYRKPLNFIRTIRKIKDVIREFKPTVIHVHEANSVALYSFLATRSFDIPVVLTTWGSDILVNPKKSVVLRTVARYVVKHADVVTADAEYLAQAVVKLVPSAKQKMVIANFGIEVHDDLNITRENIIYSNRLHKKLYNIDKIIRCFKRLDDTGQNPYRLVVAATGEDSESLKKLATDIGIAHKVEFVGWLSTEENIKMYCRSKIYVSIPDSDATSISLLEAMYYGCFPVVSDLPSKEEWIFDGKNGKRFTGDLNFVLDLTEEDFQKVAAENKEIILQKGTIRIAREKFINMYKALNV